jgi:hypothetical protein
MDNINIFYHMLCVNDYKDRFDKTYTKIKESGLLDKTCNIFVVCVGSEKEKSAKHFSQYNKVTTYIGEDDTSETSTLIKMWEFCQSNDSKVLYLHSKGVTRPNNDNINSWIDLMEYFCIEKHEKCFKALKQYDTCGVNLSYEPMKHYSGNFWWANSDYIKTRNKYDETQSSKINDKRWYCEFWLLDTDKVNPVSMYQTNCDLYITNYTRDKYDNN